MSFFSFRPRNASSYRGSALLSSCLGRMLRVLPVVALLWLLTAWALEWI